MEAKKTTKMYPDWMPFEQKVETKISEKYANFFLGILEGAGTGAIVWYFFKSIGVI